MRPDVWIKLLENGVLFDVRFPDFILFQTLSRLFSVGQEKMDRESNVLLLPKDIEIAELLRDIAKYNCSLPEPTIKAIVERAGKVRGWLWACVGRLGLGRKIEPKRLLIRERILGRKHEVFEMSQKLTNPHTIPSLHAHHTTDLHKPPRPKAHRRAR